MSLESSLGLSAGQRAILHAFMLLWPAAMTRRVLEVGQVGRAGRVVEDVRADLKELRSRGFVERFATADAPKGIREVVYLLTAKGRRAAVESVAWNEWEHRLAAIERTRPGLGHLLPQLDLILALRDACCRVVDFEVIAASGRVAGIDPDVEVTVEHRSHPRDPWRRRRVFFEFVLESRTLADGYARFKAYCARVAEITERLEEAGAAGASSAWDSAGGAVIHRNSAEQEAFVKGTTSEYGMRWRRVRGLIDSMQDGSGVVVANAERWSEVRSLEGPTGPTPPRSVIVLRHPEEIMREILGVPLTA